MTVQLAQHIFIGHILQWALGLYVLAEALNKLERADLFDGKRGLGPRCVGLCLLMAPWRWTRAKALSSIKVLGFALIALAAAGELVSEPTLHSTANVAGIALLFVRERLKEFA